MAIAQLVRRCMDGFQKAIDNQVEEGLNDELGRFRVWAGNVSAHTTERRSLQYRLRESPNLSETVTIYLEELAAALSEVQWPQPLSSSDDEADAHLFGVEESYDLPDSKSSAIDEIRDIITCLMRVSMALRNPAKDERVRYAIETSVRHFEPHDIKHVRTKFPDVNDLVVKILGGAISRHRQYFKYREEHHRRLAEGIDDDQNNNEAKHSGKGPSTIASSVDLREFDSTGFESDSESMGTATSYALSEAGDTTLHPPPLPNTSGEPFECPLCYHIIVAPNEHSWRQHIYEDLPPYVCIAPNCGESRRQFARRRDWRRHVKSHYKYWMCPKCDTEFPDAGGFEDHLKSAHFRNLNEAMLSAMLESCARDNGLPQDAACPLCSQALQSERALTKHLGHHMEQLALFALPQHLYGSSTEQEAQDEGSHDEAGSQSDEALSHVSSKPSSDPVEEATSYKESSSQPTAVENSSIARESQSSGSEPQVTRYSTTTEEMADDSHSDAPTTTDLLEAGSDKRSKNKQHERPERSEDDLYHCTHPGCSHKYKLMAEVRKHFKAKHSPNEARPHPCPHCNKRFNWPKDVQRHIRQVHDKALATSRSRWPAPATVKAAELAVEENLGDSVRDQQNTRSGGG